MEKNLKNQVVSEVFISLEGEACHVSHPTIYIRYARCNLKCPMFNNPDKLISDDGYAQLNFVPSEYKTIYDIPVIEKGCDSQYSVNTKFAHMWHHLTTDELVQQVVNLLPQKSWVSPTTGLPIILSISGGEPSLFWKQIIPLMNHPLLEQCQHILFETNCSVPLSDKFIDAITDWVAQSPTRMWTWSNSPKLSSSGEKKEVAIRPDIAARQIIPRQRVFINNNQINQYFKFVAGDNDADFEEVDQVMKQYYAAGIPFGTQIWIMPQACIEEQQVLIARAIATRCMNNGYLYCHRMQNTLWGNGVGT